MSAEATSATGGMLLAQTVGKELIATAQRVRDLEDELRQVREDLWYAEYRAEGLQAQLRAAEAGGR